MKKTNFPDSAGSAPGFGSHRTISGCFNETAGDEFIKINNVSTKNHFKWLHRFFFLFLTAFICLNASAKRLPAANALSFVQQKPTPEVTGILIQAEKGRPIVGATVTVKETKIMASSDQYGRFTIKANLGDVLVISFVGIETLQMEIKSFELGEIALKNSASSLDEVQIIAYGQTSKRLSTGNSSTVKGVDIARQPVSNPLLALSGRVPGLIINQTTGYSGSGVKVQIEGQNSINFNVGSDPLYIIDGVPYPSRMLATISEVLGYSEKENKSPTTVDGLRAGTGNPLSFINPGDIESIDVLKDADATAIYGSRAANGAILITTKKGKAGKTKVDINLQQGLGKVTRMLPLLGIQDYLQMRREAIKNNKTVSGVPDYDLNGVWDTTRYTDWQNELIGGTARYTDLQGTISGGSENTQFLVGTGYHRETTVLPGDFSDVKGSIHFNLNNVSLNNKLRFQFSGGYLMDNNKLPERDITNVAVRLAPVAPHLYKSDGTLNWAPNSGNSSTWLNPMAHLLRKYTIRTNNLIGSANLSYQILPGLELKSNFGYTNLQSNETSILPSASLPPEGRNPGIRSSIFNQTNLNSWVIEPQGLYKTAIGKGRLEALLGTTIQKNNTLLRQQYGAGYASDLVLENISTAYTSSAFQAGSIYKYNSLFGRINYNWEDKYLVNLTASRDGSSRFGPKNQFHNFGAAGIAWIFSKEDFIEDLPFLSFGKLRASYGTTGNDQIADYQYSDLYKRTAVPFDYQGAPGLTPNNIPNSYLQWEESKKMQLGLDLGFFSDKILLNANYYQNQSSNQLLSMVVPVITGFETINTNFQAVVENYGWETTLSTKNLTTKNLAWTSNFNLTIPKNNLKEFPNLASSNYASRLIVGHPVTMFRMYHYLGVDPATGLVLVEDKDGKPTSNPALLTDRISSVDTSPKFYGGFQNNVRYKGFEVDFFFQFVKQTGRNYLFGGNAAGWFQSEPSQVVTGNVPVYVLERWRKTGDNTAIPKFDNTSNSSSWANAQLSDAAFSDASFIRLKNLAISWQLPSSWTDKVQFQNARLYIQGQNLLTFTNYKGMDPETGLQHTGVGLPPLRILTTGIQITL